MNTTKQLYEAPTIRCNGEVVQHTRNNLVKNTEPDTTPQSAMGSVGFGV
jgi:hypothetical protein